MCIGEDARVWAHWNHSFDMHLNCLGPVPCSFPSWVPSEYTLGSVCSCWWLGDCSIFCLLILQETFFIHSVERNLILFVPFLPLLQHGKDLDAGKDWRQEEKGMTEDEMVGWHHWLDGHEFEWLWELVMDREASCAAVHGVTKSRRCWATELNLMTATEAVIKSARTACMNYLFKYFLELCVQKIIHTYSCQLLRP